VTSSSPSIPVGVFGSGVRDVLNLALGDALETSSVPMSISINKTGFEGWADRERGLLVYRRTYRPKIAWVPMLPRAWRWGYCNGESIQATNGADEVAQDRLAQLMSCSDVAPATTPVQVTTLRYWL